MSRELVCTIVAVFALLLAVPGAAEDITPAAQKAAAVIDALNVEQRWPAGVHEHWESGGARRRTRDVRGQAHALQRLRSVGRHASGDLDLAAVN